ncbi:MAG: TIGR03790 family protein, partial [Deltaproteobacteria bacterium]|nr:TIGR03790 family protein [Deltaproteobacteria bacterium]
MPALLWNNSILGGSFLLLCGLLLLPLPAAALQPSEVLLIANRNLPESVALARYYQQRRNIPAANLLQVSMTDNEDCSRSDYRRQLVAPLRKKLAQLPGKIRCLLLFYGLPLRVAPPELSRDEWQALEDLKYRKKAVDWQLRNDTEAIARDRLQSEAEQLQQQIDSYRRLEQGAAVDSELTLLQHDDYPLEKWLLNPYFVGFGNRRSDLPFGKDQVLMVARLDAASPEIVRRMIDDSLLAEQHGLHGRAYFDARWPLPEKPDLQGYALYDASLHKAAQLVEKLSKLPVTLDQQEALLQPGTAPDAALYSGWYSLGKYVDAFDWQPGAVAYHIASSECTT